MRNEPSTFQRLYAGLISLLFIALFAAVGVSMTLTSVLADTAPVETRENQKSNWNVSIGAGAMLKPEYMGSDELELAPLPLLDVEWRDRVFLSTRRGLGGYVLNETRSDDKLFGIFDTYNLGGSVRYAFGRDEDDGDLLRGLGDIDDTAEAGIFAELGIGPFRINAEVYADALGDGHDGVHGKLGAAYARPVTKQWFVGAGPVLKFGSEDFTQSLFGIDAAQAARSPLGQYEPEGGFYSAGIEIMSRYSFSDHWSITATAGYSRLIGDAADSPIVEDEGAFTGGAFLRYTF